LTDLLVVAAARDPEENDDGIPLNWQLPNTIGVGVADADGTTPPAILRSYGANHVDLLAPGYLIPAVGKDKAVCVDGTSFATAYVTAVAALLHEATDGDLNAAQMRGRLLATATWRSEYLGHVQGGLVDASLALTHVKENVMKVSREDDPISLEMTVTVERNKPFSATGFDRPGHRETATIYWEDVLRLTKLRDETDDNGNVSPVLFIAYLDDSHRYRALTDARISGKDQIVPVLDCTRSDGVRLQCRSMPVSSVLDYVGRRPDAHITF